MTSSCRSEMPQIIVQFMMIYFIDGQFLVQVSSSCMSVMEVVWLQEIAPIENELQILDQVLSEEERFHVVIVKILLSMLLDDMNNRFNL